MLPGGLSPPPGLVWPKDYATLNSIFHPSAITQAAPFADFCWPILFPLYKCDFSEVGFEHYPSLFFIETITFN